jgi:hypothetical protein
MKCEEKIKTQPFSKESIFVSGFYYFQRVAGFKIKIFDEQTEQIRTPTLPEFRLQILEPSL